MNQRREEPQELSTGRTMKEEDMTLLQQARENDKREGSQLTMIIRKGLERYMEAMYGPDWED